MIPRLPYAYRSTATARSLSLASPPPPPPSHQILFPSSIPSSFFITLVLQAFATCISWFLLSVSHYPALAPLLFTVRVNPFSLSLLSYPHQTPPRATLNLSPSQPSLLYPTNCLSPLFSTTSSVNTLSIWRSFIFRFLLTHFCLPKMAEIRRKLVIVGDGACGKTCLLM